MLKALNWRKYLPWQLFDTGQNFFSFKLHQFASVKNQCVTRCEPYIRTFFCHLPYLSLLVPTSITSRLSLTTFTFLLIGHSGNCKKMHLKYKLQSAKVKDIFPEWWFYLILKKQKADTEHLCSFNYSRELHRRISHSTSCDHFSALLRVLTFREVARSWEKGRVEYSCLIKIFFENSTLSDAALW